MLKLKRENRRRNEDRQTEILTSHILITALDHKRSTTTRELIMPTEIARAEEGWIELIKGTWCGCHGSSTRCSTCRRAQHGRTSPAARTCTPRPAARRARSPAHVRPRVRPALCTTHAHIPSNTLSIIHNVSLRLSVKQMPRVVVYLSRP